MMLLILLGVSLFYNYPETILKRPQSTHSWRQCDGASLALNYYQGGMHFFKPSTHGLYSDHLTTGYTSPSEIPILYFFTAILYKIFGYHEYIFRGLNLLLFYFGLLYLYKFAFEVLENFFYSTAVVLFLFSSPLIVYYANNFLPNTVGLAFTIIGWYYFYGYYRNKKTRTFLLSMLFFGFAGAMKITELMSPCIILALLLIDRLSLLQLDLDAKRHFFLKLLVILFIFLVVSGWVIYAKWYNNIHGSTQFSTFTFPIWEIGMEDIRGVLHKMNVIWSKEYFLPLTLYAVAGIAILNILFYRRIDKILGLSSIALFIGLLVYSILWFQALAEHDYFYIGFYILPVFLFINFFRIINSLVFRTIYKRLIQCLILAFVLYNVNYAQQRQNHRYQSWMNDYPEMKDLYDLAPNLEKIGISKDDTVVFYPSPCIKPLYLMNRKGWTIMNQENMTDEVVTRDKAIMKKYILNGAKYLIINDINSVESQKWLLPYTKRLIYKKGSIYIFKITPFRRNCIQM